MLKVALFLTVNAVLVVSFGLAYYIAARTYGDQAEKKRSISDHLWFSLLTQTSVGYGYDPDMTGIIKIINSVQLITIFFTAAFAMM